MSEFLTIRLNSDPQEAVSWLVWSPSRQEIIASGEAEYLSQLTHYAKDRDVVVLVDSAAMTLTSVFVPPGSERQLESVLPFLLEDELAQDVSQIHVNLLHKQDEKAFVSVVEHRIMQGWMSALSDAGMTARQVIPDCLCLPLLEGAFSAALLNKRWLVRTDESFGASVEENWLTLWLQGINQDEEELPHVVSYSPLPAGVESNWRHEHCDSIMRLLAEGALNSNVNLLTGRYKPQNEFYKYLKPWRDVAIISCILVAVLGIETGVNIYQMERQAQQYDSELEKKVKALLPSIQRFPTTSYMKRMIDNEIKQLTGSGSKTNLMVWLNDIAPIMEKNKSVQLAAIRFDLGRNELKLDAQGKDFADFEKLREAFAAAKYKTELGQLNRNQQIVTGAFVLQKES